MTRTAKVPVNERTLRAAAKRLLGNGQIVWNEIFYIQRTMASRATQIEIDESVIAVRKLSWTDITVAE